jgi:hypothetical protein
MDTPNGLSAHSKWSCFTPARTAVSSSSSRSTSLSQTPPHVAVEMAPTPQEIPIVFLTAFIPERRLPPHCVVTTTSRFGKSSFRLAIDSFSSRSSPRPRTVSR